MLVHVLLVICTLFGVTQGVSNRCRYRESRVTEQVIIRRRVCSPKLSQVGEEYWTSVGYDGKLRHGREISDFLTLPQNGDAGVRDGWVAYWITKSRYGRGLHYEAFGHAFLRQDGRVCAWFAGRDRDAVELCEGFRVLSRNKNNPNEEMPFEWIQAGYARPRETLGFHHHRIAKYEYTPADIFFGDAHLRSGTFRGVSPTSRFYMEMTKPDLFAQKVWVLRRKPESVRDLGGGLRPEWQSHQNGQRHGHIESERSAEPAWSSGAVREQYSGQPSDSRLQSHSEYPSNSEPDRMDPNAIHEVQRERDQADPNVIRDVQPESDQIDPNAIHEVHRPPPEWVTRTKPRTKSTEVHDDAGLQSRNHVRFRYVRPEVVKTDQYGKPYKPPASERDYESRRKAHNEEYLRQLDQRRVSIQAIENEFD
ncbi:unnamed protein product [Angiostrongylus costaricensis]|uniref:Conserved secreted protein n=1 Tax=Angiostrongylus costaricensis TaxID=334426 RepID=A0A158PDG0_ANGCS|nr:unnamed protein product [Angiostrongylus costaricensis]